MHVVMQRAEENAFPFVRIGFGRGKPWLCLTSCSPAPTIQHCCAIVATHWREWPATYLRDCGRSSYFTELSTNGKAAGDVLQHGAEVVLVCVTVIMGAAEEIS